MENTLKRPVLTMTASILERGRSKILNTGYGLVVIKSRLKKRIFLLRRMAKMYYS